MIADSLSEQFPEIASEANHLIIPPPYFNLSFDNWATEKYGSYVK